MTTTNDRNSVRDLCVYGYVCIVLVAHTWHFKSPNPTDSPTVPLWGDLKSSPFAKKSLHIVLLSDAHHCSALSSAAESSMSVHPYTACLNNICPITHKTFGEIETPVVFRWNLTQPYECAALAQWLRVSSRDPMTNLRIDRDCIMNDIAPLYGYSTVETVHTILGDLIGKKQSFKLAQEKGLTLFALLYGRHIVQHSWCGQISSEWHYHSP